MASDPTTIADLIRRSSHDDALRTELLADPKTVLERELSTTPPAALTVNAVEQSASEFTLVLPRSRPATTSATSSWPASPEGPGISE